MNCIVVGVLLAGDGMVILFVKLFLDEEPPPPTLIVYEKSFLNDRFCLRLLAVCGIVSLLGCFCRGVLVIGDFELLHFLCTCIAGISSLIVN